MSLSEKEKMLSGRAYDASDSQLMEERARARALLRAYNATTESELAERAAILEKLLGRAGDRVWIEPPFFCDYGTNIDLGDDVFLNFNCVILDCARVVIGAGTLLGPAVQIYAAAGSAVVGDVPAGVVAAGNPCRVLRTL